MVEDLKNGKALSQEAPERGSKAAGEDSAGLAEETAAAGTDAEQKLTGKAFHDASKRVAAIERKLAKLEEQKADLEARMAAHDPSDFAGLNDLNQQLQAVADESDSLEMEWMDLSEQME